MKLKRAAFVCSVLVVWLLFLGLAPNIVVSVVTTAIASIAVFRLVIDDARQRWPKS